MLFCTAFQLVLTCIFKVWFSTRKKGYKTAKFSKTEDKMYGFRQGKVSTEEDVAFYWESL
jgi:hypothetical protein